MIDYQFSEQDIHALSFFYEHDKLWARCTICQQTWSVNPAGDYNGVGYLELEHISGDDPMLCDNEEDESEENN